MFTGIVSRVGKIEDISHPNDWELSISIIKSSQSDNPFELDKLIIGASIACSGICLTLKKIADNLLFFDVSDETASKTNFLHWKVGTIINLEKSLKVGDEIAGHFVSGHIDGVTELKDKKFLKKSTLLNFFIPKKIEKFICEKGSVTLDGVSLTVNKVLKNKFSVNIIPHTNKITTLGKLKKGDKVNIEVDILARYINKGHN